MSTILSAYQADGSTAGRADLVALGRPHLVDSPFTLRAAAWYGATNIACPPQYLPGRDQIFRNSVRDRQEQEELRLKARPAVHADTAPVGSTNAAPDTLRTATARSRS